MGILRLTFPVTKDDSLGGNNQVSCESAGIREFFEPRFKPYSISNQCLCLANIQEVPGRWVELMGRGVGKNQLAHISVVTHYG